MHFEPKNAKDVSSSDFEARKIVSRTNAQLENFYSRYKFCLFPSQNSLELTKFSQNAQRVKIV